MTNIRTTVTSLLATVEVTANSATSLVGAGARGINMLDRYVAEHQRKQALRIAVDQTTYRSTLLNEASMRVAKSEEAIQRELDTNPILKTMYASNYAKLGEALDKAEATLS